MVDFKIFPLLDEIPELHKRVFLLKLLTEIQYDTLDDRDRNSWFGLLFDCVDLLDQSCCDMNTLASVLERQVADFRSSL